jgi:hypothetical protein
MKDEIRIAEIIKTITQAVARVYLSKLNLYFHENLKITDPNLKILGDDKKKCVFKVMLIL